MGSLGKDSVWAGTFWGFLNIAGSIKVPIYLVSCDKVQPDFFQISFFCTGSIKCFSEINQNSVAFNIDDEACTYIVPHYIGSCQQILKNGFVPSCAPSLLCSTSLEFFCKQIKGTKLQMC